MDVWHTFLLSWFVMWLLSKNCFGSFWISFLRSFVTVAFPIRANADGFRIIRRWPSCRDYPVRPQYNPVPWQPWIESWLVHLHDCCKPVPRDSLLPVLLKMIWLGWGYLDGVLTYKMSAAAGIWVADKIIGMNRVVQVRSCLEPWSSSWTPAEPIGDPPKPIPRNPL